MGVAAILYFVPRLAQFHGIDEGKAIWLAVLNPLVIMHFVAGGHNDAVMVALILAGLYAGTRGSFVGASLLIGTAAAVKPIALLVLPFVGILRNPRVWTWRQRIWDWVLASLLAGAVLAITALIAGLGFGWVKALSTPGTVQTWLSPMTALGMITGYFAQTFGWAETNEATVTFFRTIGVISSFIIGTWLCIRPQGRSATRGAGLMMMAFVVLGPVVQPWYLLWFIPILVVTGLTQVQLRLVILLTAALSVYGMVDGSSTSDALLDFSGGVTDDLGIRLRGPDPGRIPARAAPGPAAGRLHRPASRHPRAAAGRARGAGGRADPPRVKDLAASYEVCRRVCASHGRTYYLATSLVPAAQAPLHPRPVRIRPLLPIRSWTNRALTRRADSHSGAGTSMTICGAARPGTRSAQP